MKIRSLATQRSLEPVAIGALTLGVLYALGSATVDGFNVPSAVLVLGAIIGVTYGMLAVGLVLVFRASGVINFAHGEVGTLAASFFGIWVAGRSEGGFGLPYWLLFPAAMAIGAGASMAVETVAVRRLRKAPKVISLVMTLGAAQFFLFVAQAVNTKIRSGALYPRPPGLPTFEIGVLRITSENTAMLILTPLLVVALALFLTRTRYGIGVRASADSRDVALMSAIPADRMSSLAWGLAGAISAFVAVLQFPAKGFVIGGAALGPALLVRALLATVVARFTSLPVALGFGVVIGIIEQVSLWNSTGTGSTELLLFVITLAVLLVQSRDGARARSQEDWTALRPWPSVPKAWLQSRRLRIARPLALAVGGLLFVAVGMSSNRVALAFTLVIAFSIVGLSVYVITGVTGQLALGQFAIAGVGALASIRFADELLRSIPVSIVVGGCVGGILSIVIGLPALRLRGLLLAVITLSFAVAAEAWLFAQPWAFASGVQPARLVLDGDPVRTARGYFLFALPFLVGALWLVRNLSTSGYGRALRGLRDNEDGGRAFGIPATRRKLEAFAFAGFLAGSGGAVFAHGLPRVSAGSFAAAQSITVVAIALIGGLSILAGPVLGAMYLLALPALVTLDAVGLAVSTFGWLLLLLYFPGGIAQAIEPLRTRAFAALVGAQQPSTGQDEVQRSAGQEREQADEMDSAACALVRRPAAMPRSPSAEQRVEVLLSVDGLQKSFGGVHAVAGVSLSIRAGQTMGIIGPNGAGKTTLFELIGGFVRPDSGSVTFLGDDVTRLSADRRAQRGLVRSFQDARLFPTLTVRETIELASERLHPSHISSALTRWPAAVHADRAKRRAADDLIDTMGLGPYADRSIAELSTGTRRITDLAALIALRPRVILLDEPSAGVAQRETEALGALLGRLKEFLDTTFVIIEHDMPLLLGISDHVVAMESGRVIADDTPPEIVNHPAVIESYLGTDRTAIDRSDTAQAVRPPDPPATAAAVEARES